MSKCIVVLTCRIILYLKLKLKQSNNHCHLLAIWGFMGNFAPRKLKERFEFYSSFVCRASLLADCNHAVCHCWLI